MIDTWLIYMTTFFIPPDTISHLTTEPSPPRFKMDLPLQFNTSIGHKANLTCHVSGIPRPVITWFKDGSRVTRSLVRKFKGYSMLAFDSVRLNDQGKYWCEANSTEGWNRSSTANLTGISKLQANVSQPTHFSLLLLFLDSDHSDSCFCCCQCCCRCSYCCYCSYLKTAII